MKKALLLSIFAFIFTSITFAQNAEIQGRVVDEKGEGIPFANVVAFSNDVMVVGSATDFDGYFTLKPLPPGTYTVTASYLGKKVNVSGITLTKGATRFLDPIMVTTAQELEVVDIVYEEPPVDVGKPEAGSNITREQIEKMPKNNLIGIIGNTGGTYQSDDNSGVSIGGSRFNANKYILDGVDLTGVLELPTEALDQVQVITSGVDASIGDFTGGVVSMSTRGPSKTYHGTVEMLSSQFLDPYGYNQLRFSLLGPLWTQFKGTDTARSTLGFILTGELLYRKDTDPPATPMYVVNDSVLQTLREDPLIPARQGEGMNKRSEFLTMDDLEAMSYKENNHAYSANLFAKLDWKPSLTTNLTLGSTYYYQYNRAYIRTFSLMNYENNPEVFRNDYRVYAKFTQRFLNEEETEQSSGYNFENAFYSIQADYQHTFNKVQDETHEMNPFQYGYIGKFEEDREAVYGFGFDTITYYDQDGQQRERFITAYNTFLGASPNGVTYEPGEANPILARYTTDYFAENDPQALFQVLQGGALRNGDFTQNLFTYSMWYNPGVPYTSYSESNSDQYGLRFDASFDLNRTSGDQVSKHAIEFGFEYQQRVSRSYSVNPYSFWTLARQNTNLHLSNLDRANPYFIIDGDTTRAGDHFSSGGTFNEQTDTLFFYQNYNQSQQKYFDIALREKMGIPVNSLDWINIDALDPEFFSIDMFSPDELLAEGNRYVNTRGFDYYGNELDEQPAFSDFWTAYNDKNGNGEKDFGEYYTRPIGAYRPIYTAGYIQDRFNIGRVLFRVGVRVDRFDANQQVLRDPYSLYAIRSAGEVTEIGGQSVSHPGSVGDNFAVYVNDIQNPTEVVGYRSGDTWFNAEGSQIDDPEILEAATNSGTIQPFLVDPTSQIQSDDFDPDQSFQDYDPQITVMPRIAFSFPITETAMFTAHYDVLTQRPLSGIVGSPYHYYFMQELAIDGVLPNPNLKPEKTINYQLGFQQALSDKSALKISAFYKELRDMTQIIRYDFAYPINYSTYGNIDFGTVKGLTVGYDQIRRVSNILLSASYTLQFADGTGSNATSQVNLIAAGQPNLRTILPLDYDVRHTFNINLDYRFPGGPKYNGPVLFDQNFLENFGINIAFRARSGEPFTRQANPVPSAMFGVRTSSNLEGTINGSRLPWNYKIDFRIDKDFTISSNPDNPIYLNVYLLVQNALNTLNVVAVYPYTGDPVDDGYLAAPSTQDEIAGQTNPQSFIDLYNVKVQNPSMFSMPRRTQLGVKFRF